jgi:hypothetical protein
MRNRASSKFTPISGPEDVVPAALGVALESSRLLAG